MHHFERTILLLALGGILDIPGSSRCKGVGRGEELELFRFLQGGADAGGAGTTICGHRKNITDCSRQGSRNIL